MPWCLTRKSLQLGVHRLELSHGGFALPELSSCCFALSFLQALLSMECAFSVICFALAELGDRVTCDDAELLRLVLQSLELFGGCFGFPELVNIHHGNLW